MTTYELDLPELLEEFENLRQNDMPIPVDLEARLSEWGIIVSEL